MDVPPAACMCTVSSLTLGLHPQILAYVNRVLDIGSDVDHDTFTLEQVQGRHACQQAALRLSRHGISRRTTDACMVEFTPSAGR